MRKLLFFFGIILLAALGIFALLRQNQKSNSDVNLNTKNFGAGENKIIVIATLFPLYDFAKTIGQDKIDVFLLLPPGLEAHSFEPKPSDIAKIDEADVFLYTGKFMEPWAEDIIQGLSSKNIKIVDASFGIKMIPAVVHDEDELEGSMDPHIWLDFDNAKIMVENIVRALSEKDPDNTAYYQQKANEYKNELSNLDNDYKTTLSKCKSKKIVYGGHYAFGYLAKRYNLECLAAQGLAPDAEPSAKDLVQLVQQIKKENIQYVFYEELTSPKIAQTLANETRAKMLLLNAAHNLTKEAFERNTTFLSIMKDNLENLKIGLECK